MENMENDDNRIGGCNFPPMSTLILLLHRNMRARVAGRVSQPTYQIGQPSFRPFSGDTRPVTVLP